MRANAGRIFAAAGATVLLAACLSGGSPSSTPTPQVERLLSALAAGRCPAAHPALSGTGTGADTPLVPAGTDGLLVICHYPGLEAPNATAAPTAVHDAVTVKTLGSQLDALPAVPAGTYNCPADNGERDLLAFFDPGGRGGVLLAASLSGCRFVTGGNTAHGLSPAVLHRLAALDR